MNYAYLRISTVAQDEQNQRQGVDLKAKQLNLQIDKYIIDKVSGVKEPKVRNLGKLINRLKKGWSKAKIARKCKVCDKTLRKYIKTNL